MKTRVIKLLVVFTAGFCIMAVIIVALAVTLSGRGVTSTLSSSLPSSSYKTTRFAAVTTDTTICSPITVYVCTGRWYNHWPDNILAQGGSAVDAGIVAHLCNCIVNAASCGIGGGHVATIYERTDQSTGEKQIQHFDILKPNNGTEKQMQSLIARERAPLAADQNMYINASSKASVLVDPTEGMVMLFCPGGLSIAVPGEIHGFYTAWKVYGRLNWSSLFTDVIRLCYQGFKIEQRLASAIISQHDQIMADPGLKELFMKPDGTLMNVGDLLLNPKLAVTLQTISNDPMSFYNGSLAQDIVADIQERGGIITIEDLSNYNSQFKLPIVTSLKNGGYTLYNPPPPSSGVVLSFILNVLDGYNLSSADISTPDRKLLTYQRIVEAFKFAYAKRSQLGDADFVNVTDLVNNLTSKEYGSTIRQQINDTFTQILSYYGPTFSVVPDHGTSHMNVLTADGGAMAATSTINFLFGSCIRGRRTGIIFNDEMDDFSTPGTVNNWGVPASPSNYIRPGKIPQSSMAPTIVLDQSKRVVFLSGSAGGTQITTSIAFTMINSLWLGLNLQQSTDAARIHHQLLPNQVNYETWLDTGVVNGLKSKNHVLVSQNPSSVVNSIRNECPVVRDSSSTVPCIESVSDGRRGGIPDGF